MNISAIGMQSYSIQNLTNELKKNISFMTDDRMLAVNTTKTGSDRVTISEHAQEAEQVAANAKELKAREEAMLKQRGLSDNDIDAFREIRQRADDAASAKDFLLSLSRDKLDLLKRANSYGIELTYAHVKSMSDEGARNLLVSQDMRSFVDYNNDGVVDHGVGHTFVFPPPNSPQDVKDAWYKTIDALPENERLLASTVFLGLSLVANAKFDAHGNTVGFYSPGEDGYTNIFPTDRSGWSRLLQRVDDYLDWEESVDPKNPSIARDRNMMRLFRECLGE